VRWLFSLFPVAVPSGSYHANLIADGLIFVRISWDGTDTARMAQRR